MQKKYAKMCKLELEYAVQVMQIMPPICKICTVPMTFLMGAVTVTVVGAGPGRNSGFRAVAIAA